LVAFRASSKARRGRMVGRRLASIVFPEPGGPTSNMLATVRDVRVEIVVLSSVARAA
jgi:hypothetical protein